MNRKAFAYWVPTGLCFNLIGATASHAFSGDPMSHTVRPAIVLALCVASYLLRPATRRLTSAAFLVAAADRSG